MKFKLGQKVRDKLYEIVGDIKLYSTPMWFIYRPKSNKISSEKLLTLAEMLIRKKIYLGDIILRTCDDYLDSYFIPSTWKHAGIYVGKNMILHSTSEGVHLIHFMDFLKKADKLCILRYDKLNKSQRYKVAEYAKTLLGKEYDYAYSLATNKFYCSEIIYHIYEEHFNYLTFDRRVVGFWPFTKKRQVITADEIYNNKQLKVVFNTLD